MLHEKKKSNVYNGQQNEKEDARDVEEVSTSSIPLIDSDHTFSFVILNLDRERIELQNNHLDGMSSDDEVPDHEITLYKNQISKCNSRIHLVVMMMIHLQHRSMFSEQINAEATLVFADVTEEFSDLSTVLQHFEGWRNRDINSYKDTYFSLCLPKVKRREHPKIVIPNANFIFCFTFSDHWANASVAFIGMEST